MSRPRRTGFTIVELIVVMAIISILIGLVLPALGNARDAAREAVSRANLRNMAIAHAAYAADWNDRQLTTVADNIGDFGTSSRVAFEQYRAQYGLGHPNILLGRGPHDDGHGQAQYVYWLDVSQPSYPHHWWAGNPIDWYGSESSPSFGFGRFRLPNVRAFSQCLSGRWYAPEFYAPKDTLAHRCARIAFEAPGEFIPPALLPCASPHAWSSYCLSPAAMMSPQVLSLNRQTREYYRDPWSMPAGLRTPAMSHALYASLKTHMLEHHWLQNRATECNRNFTGGTYEGCEPYYFNHGWQSSPLALFYDGHVNQVGVKQAELADARMFTQSSHGLWSRDTPLGGDRPGADTSSGGYFCDYGYDKANTSFHILTLDGIRGRDTLPQ